ncbi:hypothetical protein [Thalassospira marina]|uniref:Uncharacterized protein n=1 Tax=Thalassospira marina TaxID=2048283 RepID=A0ABN5FGQ5_9PROT|nr:hypothetical protein [Thalassospira marina]AUG52009.1 hypothetical protein CSC3H3_04185 [Thalassospira marina]
MAQTPLTFGIKIAQYQQFTRCFAKRLPVCTNYTDLTRIRTRPPTDQVVKPALNYAIDNIESRNQANITVKHPCPSAYLPCKIAKQPTSTTPRATGLFFTNSARAFLAACQPCDTGQLLPNGNKVFIFMYLSNLARHSH